MVEKKGRNATALYCDDASLTQQHFITECDINEIIKRAEKGEVVSHVNSRVPSYGDFSNIPSYADAFAVVKRAEEVFMSMPWQQRERFNNDPQKMLDFLGDSRNREEAIKLGLVKPPEAPPKAGSDADPKKPAAAGGAA